MNKKILYFLTCLALIVGLPSYAEVSDKMPSNSENLLTAFVIASVVGLVAWYRWWLGVFGVVAFALYLSGVVSLWRETHMKEALLNEQGWYYFGILVIGSALIICCTILGSIISIRRHKNA